MQIDKHDHERDDAGNERVLACSITKRIAGLREMERGQVQGHLVERDAGLEWLMGMVQGSEGFIRAWRTIYWCFSLSCSFDFKSSRRRHHSLFDLGEIVSFARGIFSPDSLPIEWCVP